jgi:L-asparagine transporter-like permease
MVRSPIALVVLLAAMACYRAAPLRAHVSRPRLAADNDAGQCRRDLSGTGVCAGAVLAGAVVAGAVLAGAVLAGAVVAGVERVTVGTR